MQGLKNLHSKMADEMAEKVAEKVAELMSGKMINKNGVNEKENEGLIHKSAEKKAEENVKIGLEKSVEHGTKEDKKVKDLTANKMVGAAVNKMAAGKTADAKMADKTSTTAATSSASSSTTSTIVSALKKGASAKRFGSIAKQMTKLPEKVLYARNSRGQPGSRAPVAGGEPITEAQAIELRTVVFGSAACPPRGEWLRTPLSPRQPRAPLSFGLSAPRNATRGLLSVVSAHLLKYLLFEVKARDAQGKYLLPEALLRPDEVRQEEALCAAISEIIWRAGETKKCVMGLPQDAQYVQHSTTYYQDSITEKLNLFEFTKLEDLQIFVKRYLHTFVEDPGCGALILLFAAVLSRGLQNVKKDLDGRSTYLVSAHIEGSLNVVMLLLTGRATPFLHNGVVYVGDEDHYALPQYGVLSRSTIGFLVWKGSEDQQDTDKQPPGSRLKTPALPIWVTYCVGHYGLMFNTNRELLRNYHAERRFDLQYYTCGGCHVQLCVDTRAINEGGSALRDDINATPLEKLIHSKWQDAKVTWTGQTPYVGEAVAN